VSLRIRALLIRVRTSAGLRGVRLDFASGLNVIRAENSMGKSACVNAIAYGLGLDAMITTSHSPYLPNALTDHLNVGEDREAVVSSEVFLEIENHEGEILTTRRVVAGNEQNRHLVNVWRGPAITAPDDPGKQTDYYVREKGAATEAHGFHAMLARYIGWTLPMVPRFNGPESPLYIETIFPLLFIEQKKGWTSIRSRFPTQFGIRDVSKRAFEFLLDLDAYELAVARQELRDALHATREAWGENAAAVDALARVFGALAQYVPASPVAAWPPQVTPRLVVPRGDDVEDARAIVAREADRLAQLEKAAIPDVGSVADARQADLQDAERELSELQYQVTNVASTLERESAELSATRTRLVALRDDVRKMRDALKLVRLGSEHSIAALEGSCPTCHQLLTNDALHDSAALAMPLDENVKFVTEQIAVFELVESESNSRVMSLRALLDATNRRLAEVRGRVRALRKTLVSDPRMPSVADVEERIALAARVRELTKLLEAFSPLLARFSELSARWAELQSRRSELGDAEVSPEDDAKLERFENSFRQQLREYEFSSEQVAKIIISRSSYQPESEGFDVEADASASDMIRVIWSYVLGILETARTTQTNHPGLVIFDEPRQQSTARVSFQRLIQRATLAERFNQQVIFATSEEREVVEEALHDRPHSLRIFDAKILGPLDDSD